MGLRALCDAMILNADFERWKLLCSYRKRASVTLRMAGSLRRGVASLVDVGKFQNGPRPLVRLSSVHLLALYVLDSVYCSLDESAFISVSNVRRATKADKLL